MGHYDGPPVLLTDSVFGKWPHVCSRFTRRIGWVWWRRPHSKRGQVGRPHKQPVVPRRRTADPATRVHDHRVGVDLARSDGSRLHHPHPHPHRLQCSTATRGWTAVNTCLDSSSGSYQPTWPGESAELQKKQERERGGPTPSTPRRVPKLKERAGDAAPCSALLGSAPLLHAARHVKPPQVQMPIGTPISSRSCDSRSVRSGHGFPARLLQEQSTFGLEFVFDYHGDHAKYNSLSLSLCPLSVVSAKDLIF